MSSAASPSASPAVSRGPRRPSLADQAALPTTGSTSGQRRLPLLLGIALAACSTDPSINALRGSNDPANGDSALSIRFDESVYDMTAGTDLTLTVAVSPPSSTQLRFALLGDAQDSFLSTTTAQTSAEGRTSLQLSSRTTLGSFSIRAWNEDGSGEAAIRVTLPGHGSVRVFPDYDGTRSPTDWVASITILGSVAADASDPCGLPLAFPLDDGPLSTTGAAANLVLPQVSAGQDLTVLVRSGQFVAGCIVADSITARSESTIVVPVHDRPMNWFNQAMSVSLDIDVEDALDSQFLLVGTDAFPAEASTLLDAMAASASPDSASFETARTNNSWDTTLTGRPLFVDQSPVSGVVNHWLKLGFQRFLTEGLRGTLTNIDTEAGTGHFRIDRFGGLDAVRSGLQSAEVDVRIVIEAGDQFRFATDVADSELLWAPGGLGTELMALASISPTEGAEIRRTDLCTDVSLVLLGINTNAFANCNAACVDELCRDALDTLGATSGPSSSAQALVITAAGQAIVDDNAYVEKIDGQWIGQLGDGVSFEGAFLASPSVP
ncbi:MAG: hypothetical protein HRU17_12325 [Polyangiaceae bacterium]|nr:hypothetical protein [Polyangiaceae bacterium]